jgi:hypothetical protein
MRYSTLLLALLPLLGLGELGLHGYFATRAPDFDAYQKLAPELLRRKQPGIPVVVAPRWAEPLLRQAAPAAFPIAELTRPEDNGFSAFLEVSLHGARAPELAGYPIRDQKQVGPFTLLLRDNPHFEVPKFDFVTALDNGEVEVWSELAGERRPCAVAERARGSTGGLHGPAARQARRYECPGARVVGVTLIEDQHYRPRRCILVDPAKSGRVVLHFSSVPPSRRLVGFTGFSYFLSRDYPGRPAELSISEGQRELGRAGSEPREGWKRFELPRPAPGGGVEVAVTRSADEPGDFCFALEAR